MSVVEFLAQRIAEDALKATRYHRLLCLRVDYSVDEPGPCNCGYPERILAECRAKQAIIELHKKWPVLVEKPPVMELEPVDYTAYSYRFSQEIAWFTQEEYRKRFGEEPPTAPIIREMAAVYAAHPDFQQEWRP